MADVAEVPEQLDRALAPSPDVQLLVDLGLGVVGGSIGLAVAIAERVNSWSPLVARVVSRPALLPARLRPASLAADLARRGAKHRELVTERLLLDLDAWVPVVAEMVGSWLDLTGLITRHVDLDTVVSEVDLNAVVSEVDLNAAVVRVDLDAVVGRVDFDAAVNAVDIDAIVQRLDIDAVIARVDLVALVEEVIATIDLPAIIRESNGSMASETVRGARMTGITVDEAVSRNLKRHGLWRRPLSTPAAPTMVTP